MQPSENVPEFEGKLLLIYFRSPGDQQYALIEQAQFETQGGRLFVVGRLPQFRGGWGQGLRTAIAWDTIQQYFILDSVEQYEKAGSSSGGLLGGLLKR